MAKYGTKSMVWSITIIDDETGDFIATDIFRFNKPVRNFVAFREYENKHGRINGETQSYIADVIDDDFTPVEIYTDEIMTDENDDTIEITENVNDFCVTLMYETPEMVIAQKHIMNCDRATANCYKRHFDKLNGHLWNDWKNSGLYCLVVSRIWCTNHMDFERDDNVNQINGFYKM